MPRPSANAQQPMVQPLAEVGETFRDAAAIERLRLHRMRTECRERGNHETYDQWDPGTARQPQGGSCYSRTSPRILNPAWTAQSESQMGNSVSTWSETAPRPTCRPALCATAKKDAAWRVAGMWTYQSAVSLTGFLDRLSARCRTLRHQRGELNTKLANRSRQP